MFIACCELLLSGQIWKVLITERRDPRLVEYISIANITVIKERNIMMLRPNDIVEDALLYRSGIWSGFVSVYYSDAIFNTAARTYHVFGRFDYRESKARRQASLKCGWIKTIFDIEIIGRRLPAILNINSNDIVHHILWRRADWPELASITRMTPQFYVTSDTNIGAQLPFFGVSCGVYEFGRSIEA